MSVSQDRRGRPGVRFHPTSGLRPSTMCLPNNSMMAWSGLRMANEPPIYYVGKSCPCNTVLSYLDNPECCIQCNFSLSSIINQRSIVALAPPYLFSQLHVNLSLYVIVLTTTIFQQNIMAFRVLMCRSRMAEVVELSTTTREGPGSNPGAGKKFSDWICKYLSLF